MHLKPEDFFGLILSFSSSLQKAALEVHDAMPKVELSSPKIAIEEPASPTAEEGVRSHSASAPCKKLIAPQTIKGKDGDTLRPPPSSQSRATGRSIGRGDLDQAIRSMRSGRRRERNPASRPLGYLYRHRDSALNWSSVLVLCTHQALTPLLSEYPSSLLG